MLFTSLHKLKKLKWQLIHIFSFQKPLLTMLEYERVVLSKKGFLLLYWKTRHSNHLQIPAINRCIFKSTGVILIPLETANDIKSQICNTWHKETFILELTPVNVTFEKPKEIITQFKNLKPVVKFKSLNKTATPVTFSFKTNEPKFLLNQFSFSINEEAINFSKSKSNK